MQHDPIRPSFLASLRLGAIPSLVCGVVAACQSALPPGPEPAYDLIVTGAMIVSPESVHDGQVLDVAIDAGQIVTVGDLSPDSARNVIDADGRFLLPGLIDGHVHLYHATGLRRRDTPDFEALHAAYLRQMPRSYLFHGFTTVVELNADPETNARFLEAPDRPRLTHCGPGVVLPDGFMALEVPLDALADAFPALLHDRFGRATLAPGMLAADHTPEAVLDAIQAAGGECVKLYYEEALWWPGGAPDFALPSLPILREVTAAARARGLPVLLHATTPAGVEVGISADVDILAHGPWEWPQDGFAAPAPGQQVTETMAALAGTGIGMQSTMRTLANTGSLFRPELLDDPAWLDVIPGDMLRHLRSGAQIQRDQFLSRFGPVILASGQTVEDMPALQANFFHRYQALLACFHQNGGSLLFGTDTAVGGFGWASPPGLAGYWEMRDWEESGISPEDILAAATIRNARAFGMGDQRGLIAAGYDADLLILNADPRVAISAFEQIETVVLEGRPIDRASLSAQAE
ncbi:amidohydrolase family protein [Maricaulis sp.]|uniref:amidohydrolase family protein n=1 Tax=Maricaulis sp. TaxID=1486257 RepID=UPI0026308ADA|nr:amidohydrolase family protein [Maricaulis sp.]MDF1767875.1 amidohydrolase family protein [Maricaulis sp.]